MLEDDLLPAVEESFGDVWTLMLDGTSVHWSHHTVNWLESNDVCELDSTAKSPDLNIIENVLGEMVRIVNKDRTQYYSTEICRWHCWSMGPKLCTVCKRAIRARNKAFIGFCQKEMTTTDYFRQYDNILSFCNTISFCYISFVLSKFGYPHRFCCGALDFAQK